MASKRLQSSEVLEDQVLTIRKKYNPNKESAEYSIIWKLPQESNNCIESFVIDYYHIITHFRFNCYLKFNFDLEDYYDIVLELHGVFIIDWYLLDSMHISLSLIDKNKRIRNTTKKFINSINKDITKIDFAKFIKKADLFDKSNGFFSNEKLTIYCKIYNGEERNTTEEILLDDDSSADCQLKVLDNFEQLLLSEKFSDMKFIIGSKELKVHKNILSAQSPVFEAMFKHDTQEQRNNSVEIIDVSYETMTEVLRFVYSAKVNNIKKMAKDIFIAADKYEIDALKMICEHELIECLNVENISDVLMLVDRYDSEYLKKHVFHFITINAKDVNNREDFHETLDISSLNLFKEINQILMSRI